MFFVFHGNVGSETPVAVCWKFRLYRRCPVGFRLPAGCATSWPFLLWHHSSPSLTNNLLLFLSCYLTDVECLWIGFCHHKESYAWGIWLAILHWLLLESRHRHMMRKTLLSLNWFLAIPPIMWLTSGKWLGSSFIQSETFACSSTQERSCDSHPGCTRCGQVDAHTGSVKFTHFLKKCPKNWFLTVSTDPGEHHWSLKSTEHPCWF